MRVLVGGGTGFIGSALVSGLFTAELRVLYELISCHKFKHQVKHLRAIGHEATIISRNPVPGEEYLLWDDLAAGIVPAFHAVRLHIH